MGRVLGVKCSHLSNELLLFVFDVLEELVFVISGHNGFSVLCNGLLELSVDLGLLFYKQNIE